MQTHSATPATEPSSLAIRLRFLDALRGLAALYVTLGHASTLLHESFRYGYANHPEAYGPLATFAVYVFRLFGWGGEAVILFFVLSGFAIHLRYAREQAALGPDARLHIGQYLWRRAKRLYPPLLLALGLTFCLDKLGMAQNWAIYSGKTGQWFVDTAIPAIYHDGQTLLGNLAFVMGHERAPVHTFGTDGPLWSLRYEAWFYLFYPAIWLLNRKSAWLSTACIATVSLTLMGLEIIAPMAWYHIPAILRDPLQLLLVWWFGSMLAEMLTGRLRIAFKTVGWLALLLPLSMHGLVIQHLHIPFPLHFLLQGLGCAGVIATCMAWRDTLSGWKWLDLLGKLGDCSYTLYVIHMPILVFLGGWLMSRSPDGRHLPVNPIWVIPGTALCVALAWGAHFVVEKPFIGSRKKKAKP